MRAATPSIISRLEAAETAAALARPAPADAATALLRDVVAAATTDRYRARSTQAAVDARLTTTAEIAAALRDGHRRAALIAACSPELARDAERTWQAGRSFPLARPAVGELWFITQPHEPQADRADARALDLLEDLLALGLRYRLGLDELLRYADGLSTGHGAVGTAAALAIDAGDDHVRQTLDDLLDRGTWNQAIAHALLRQRDPASWARAHDVLLAAGREEGLRMAIAQAAGESSPEAFTATLRVIVEHDLTRFASIASVAGSWLGLPVDAEHRALITHCTREALELLDDPGRRDARLRPGGGPVWRPLWAMAIGDLAGSLAAARTLLADPEAPRRAAAVLHLAHHHDEPGVRDALVPLLDDPELRIAIAAAEALVSLEGGSDRIPATGGASGRLLERLPKETSEVAAIPPLPACTASRSDLIWLISAEAGAPELGTFARLRDTLGAGARATVVHRHGAQLARDHRSTLLTLLTDPSPTVREHAFGAAADLTLREDELLALEPHLRRKVGDLRHGVISLIRGAGDAHALGAMQRLAAGGTAAMRLAAVELAAGLARSDDPTSATPARRQLESATSDRSDDIREAAARALTALGAEQEPTEDDGFGLFDPADLTPPRQPADGSVRLADDTALTLIRALAAFLTMHADDQITVRLREGGPHEEETVAIGELSYRHRHTQLRTATLREELAHVLRDAGPDHDLTLMRSALLVHIDDRLTDAVPRTHEFRIDLDAIGPGCSVGLQVVMDWLLDDHESAASRELLLDATETLLAMPTPVPAGDASGARFARSVALTHGRLPRMRFASERLARTHAQWSDEHLARYWGLCRWVSETDRPTLADCSPYDDTRDRRSARLPRRPALSDVVLLHARGIVRDADVLDHLIGPRGLSGSRDLAWILDPFERGTVAPAEPTLELARRARDRIVGVELARGEAPTRATAMVSGLRDCGGAHAFVEAVRVLGRQGIDRGGAHRPWAIGPTMSSIIRASWPRPEETPAEVAALLRKTGLSRQRALELACFAPQWSAHLGAAVGVPELADAVWWVRAHTRDEPWLPDEIRTQERAIGERTELPLDAFADGAVDVEWFARVRAAIGPRMLFDELLPAARFASSNGGHKRAELFARALDGKVPLRELRERISATRHQDSLRALGLRPLSPRRRDADLRERFALIVQFRRESRQFGSQRQASERLAAEVAMMNLARTAGYRDPMRLSWALEAAATDDLRGAGVTVHHEGATVGLRIDDTGAAQLSVARGARVLKAVPAKVRRVPQVAALVSRSAEIRRSASRVRDGLDQAMVRGDAFRASEVAALRAHAVLWPQLRELVMVGGSPEAPVVGRLATAADALEDVDSTQHPLVELDELRIAHPIDLLATGRWRDWQRRIVREQRAQPFKQVFRELYTPVADECDERQPAWSRRYAGHQVHGPQARALLTARGWRCPQADGPMRTLRQEQLIARVEVVEPWGTPLEVQETTLDGVWFMSTATGQPVPLPDVPPRVFSEVMRDLDLVVSVAHAGGAVREASMSSIEQRAALVRETVALLGIANVRVDGRRVLIDGAIGRYAVHLGSAVVSQRPGGGICIVPVHEQQRGRVFLPFADDDPRSAEVLAKVLLLAADDAIADPSIRAQLLATTS